MKGSKHFHKFDCAMEKRQVAKVNKQKKRYFYWDGLISSFALLVNVLRPWSKFTKFTLRSVSIHNNVFLLPFIIVKMTPRYLFLIN